MQARKFILKNYFEGVPNMKNFEMVEETLTDNLKDGEILIKAICLSVDPYMRPFGNKVNVGDILMGSQIGIVLKSRNPKFPENTKVIAYVGWRDLTICNPDNQKSILSGIIPLPIIPGVPDSYGLGATGMTGMAAYFGFLKICQPKSGETVVVSSAAGAVGSLVCQIAKIKGCKVLAFCSSDEKVNWLREELGLKFAFNYKEVHLDSILKKWAVEGVDIYFDNVGGEFSCTVLNNMKENGRVAVCGSTSTYNEDYKTFKIPFDFFTIIYKQIKIEGFIVSRWANEFPEAIKTIAQWISEEKLKIRETKAVGFENMPKAFIELFEGKPIGKSIVMA